jgi:hypothetical protein
LASPLDHWSGSPWPVRVFAVDDCSAQLTWRASPLEDLRLEVGDAVAHPAASAQATLVLSPPGRASPDLRPNVAALAISPGGAAEEGRWARFARAYVNGSRVLDPAWPAGPGAVVVGGLSPNTAYEVLASARGVPRFCAGRLATLRPPMGRLLCRFATVSDLHVGEKWFGILGRIHDPCRDETFPVRALQAGLDEIASWGAELVVAKGDLTRKTSPAEVRDVARILAGGPVPVEALLGNHDNGRVNARAVLESEGLAVAWGPKARDLPGIRLVLQSTDHGNPGHRWGQLPPAVGRRIAALAAEARTGAWVGLHHPPERHRLPTVYPPGLPFDDAQAFLKALAEAKPGTLVTCGHRHRNRRYDLGPVVVSEVGSTKDYPGVWAGYKVFEGGLLQTVRRISRPDVISWTEATRRAMNGQWGRWSPGRLADRCFTIDWPNYR